MGQQAGSIYTIVEFENMTNEAVSVYDHYVYSGQWETPLPPVIEGGGKIAKGKFEKKFGNFGVVGSVAFRVGNERFYFGIDQPWETRENHCRVTHHSYHNNLSLEKWYWDFCDRCGLKTDRIVTNGYELSISLGQGPKVTCRITLRKI